MVELDEPPAPPPSRLRRILRRLWWFHSFEIVTADGTSVEDVSFVGVPSDAGGDAPRAYAAR